jgi:hypothetical protein
MSTVTIAVQCGSHLEWPSTHRLLCKNRLVLEDGKQKVLTSCLHRPPIVSKTLFIIPTDAHYYKSVDILKQFKVTTIAPTCLGSRRNHHQGAVLCLAKTTDMVV